MRAILEDISSGVNLRMVDQAQLELNRLLPALQWRTVSLTVPHTH